MDNDGSYYRLTISVGKNGQINTVYNVGKIKEVRGSLVAQRPGKKLPGSVTSNNNISQKGDTVNNNSTQNLKNYSSDSSKASIKGASNVEISRRNTVEKRESKKYNKNIKIPYNESVQLRDYIMHENNSGAELRDISYKSVGNNFYVWRNDSKTSYTVIRKIKIDGNENVIRDLRSDIENGTYRVSEKLNKAYERRSQYGNGRYNSSNALYKGRGTTDGDGKISPGKPESNTVGYTPNGGGDKSSAGGRGGQSSIKGASNKAFSVKNNNKKIKIPYNESVQLRDYIMSKNNSGELKAVDCKSIGNNFYVWRNDSRTDYVVTHMLAIEGSEDLIRLIRKGVESGVYRETKDVSRMLDELDDGYGNDDRRGIVGKDRQSNIADGKIPQVKRRSDGRGDIAESYGDSGRNGRNSIKGTSNQDIAERSRLIRL